MPTFSDQQVRAVIRGAKTFQTLPFPGTDGKVMVAVRLLTEGELDTAAIEAQRVFRDRMKQRSWDPVQSADVDPELFGRLKTKSIVARAFYDPDTVETEKPVPFFAGFAEVNELDAVTVTDLFGMYVEHQDWVSPLRSIKDEDVDGFLDALKKERLPKVYLGGYEPRTLRRLLISMASRLPSTSPTSRSTSSSGS